MLRSVQNRTSVVCNCFRASWQFKLTESLHRDVQSVPCYKQYRNRKVCVMWSTCHSSSTHCDDDPWSVSCKAYTVQCATVPSATSDENIQCVALQKWHCCAACITTLVDFLFALPTVRTALSKNTTLPLGVVASAF